MIKGDKVLHLAVCMDWNYVSINSGAVCISETSPSEEWNKLDHDT